jgi:hypothetical protein
LSSIVSAALAVLLFLAWIKAAEHQIQMTQLTTEEDVIAAIADYVETMRIEDGSQIVRIPTGFYIQSLDFFDSTHVYLTGYIWKRFPSVLPAEFEKWGKGCDHDQAPFIFPDQVNSGSDIEPELRYQKLEEGHYNLCGWYFEVTLRQKFDYKKYPFDIETVSLRLWTRDLLENVVLVPDLKAYPMGTGLNNVFGIDQNIVLSSWERENTFFSYTRTRFDTNLGFYSGPGDEESEPRLLSEALELNYNFVLKRSLINSMVEHLLGIFVMMVLLFATMLVVSRNPVRAERHGFTTSMVLGACSALFFVVLIAHIQLREQFSGTKLVYLEFYYYLMYLLLIGTTVNTYVFSEEANRFTSLFHWRDNLIPKLFFWPLVLLYAVAVTFWMMQW